MTDATPIDDLRCSADVARRCAAAAREASNYTVAGHHDAEADMLCAAADRIEALTAGRGDGGPVPDAGSDGAE